MSEILVEQQDHGKTFEVSQGDLIVIRLDENLTTGFQWEIEVADSTVVELLDSNYSAKPEEHRLGKGGVRTIRFEVKSSGSERIILRLRRRWEPEDKAIESVEVNLKAR